MAEVAAVGWLVSPMIKVMVDKARSYIEGQYSWHKDMQEDLRKLESTLIQLQTVVAVAERRQTQDESQAALLRQLKDAVYETDDLLDEFQYRVMEARAKKAQGMVSRATSSSVKFAKRLVGRDKLRTKLTELLNKLVDVNKSADRFIQVAGLEQRNSDVQNNFDPSRVTGSILPVTQVFGRDKEKNEIISLLLKIPNKPASSYTTIPVISIVGVGGVGKTTLAQIVYNDKRVEDHFDIMIWVCVSDNFDERKLTRNILSYASHGKEVFVDSNDFALLQRELQTKLKSKRFLLVLDDVWINEGRGKMLDQQMWENVLAPLRHGGKGSAILMTTRMRIVAQMFDSTLKLVTLHGLTDDENWSLLKKCAFSDEIPDNYLELQQIGIQIVQRLNGSPLAAKLVGAMLKDTRDSGKWMEILEREMFNDVMSVLRLSYQRLPNHLKPCFAYCSIFPKDLWFDPEKLVLLWIAQGYIQSQDSNERAIKDIGMHYFNELLLRSFFQKIEQDSDTYYVIHDLIHDLAESVSADECYRIDDQKQSAITKPIRHLSITVSDINEDETRDLVAQLETSNLKNLRTLMFFGGGGQLLGLQLSMFEKLRRLRVLDLGTWTAVDFLRTVGDLKHLRYLNLGKNCQHYLNPSNSSRLQLLPESLGELYHLQVLGASGDVSFCKSIDSLTRFGELNRLDVHALEMVVEKRRGTKEAELRFSGGRPNLKRLEVRGYWGGGWPSWLETNWLTRVENAALLDWGCTSREVHSRPALALGSLPSRKEPTVSGSTMNALGRAGDVFYGITEGTDTHPNLKWLEIRRFRGSRPPSWFETNWLINVETVELSDCGCWEVLPPLGSLPSLRILTVSRMNAVRQVGSGFYGGGVRGFPSLELLDFYDMTEWSEWCEAEEFPVFPRLRGLKVFRCPKLMLFPLLPPTLRDIDIRNTGLISLFLLSSTYAFESTVTHLGVLLHDRIQASIEYLKIRDCKEPMPAAARGLLGLVSLKYLRVEGCPELLALSIPEEEGGTGVLPSSLESLVIYNCRVADRWMSRCLRGLASLSELEIRDCTGLLSLPSAWVLHHLTALRRLVIYDCEDLMSLGGLHVLESLGRLEVAHCPKLKALPEEGLPASIEYLFLQECDPALEQQLRKKIGPEWGKVAHIPRVETDCCSPELSFHFMCESPQTPPSTP